MPSSWKRRFLGSTSELGDKLSPILVKELRQGVRSNMFTGSFLLLQTLLFLFGITMLVTESYRYDPSAGAFFYWAMLGVPLLLLIPATAAQAVEKEVTGHTLELLLLTRLSSYRIVLGKWFSVIVQTTLLLTSVLPYVMLRYFLGGIDLWFELKVIAALMVTSGVLAGIAMGFWATKASKWVKWGVVAVFFWALQGLLAFAFMPHGGSYGAGSWAIVGIYGVLVMFMMLEMAASRIAPPAENHTSRIRLLAFLGLLATFLFSGAGRQLQALSTTMALLLLVPAVIAGLNERIQSVSRLYAPFKRAEGFRFLLMFPFAPGWPGGVAFALLGFLAVPWIPVFQGEFKALVWIALLSVVFFPVLCVRSLLRRSQKPLGLYVGIFFLTTVPAYVWSFARSLGLGGLAETILFFSGLFPATGAVLALDNGYRNAGVMPVLLLVVVAAASVFFSIMRARDAWQSIDYVDERMSSQSDTAPDPGGAVEPTLEAPV